MRITLLVPCYNEERSIRSAIRSWLGQTRMPDEIIVVDDSSSDATPDILREFSDVIRVVKTPSNLGNKSFAQEFGLQFVTGDIFVTTDADTMLHEEFIERMEKDFEDQSVIAVGGYIRSIKYNWITRHRAFEYAICQNLHKIAQNHLDCMFVIPGAAGAFRTDVFRDSIHFDHDTVAEDLDFTYKLHAQGSRVLYDREAVVFTQDPATLHSYINQVRRWFGGGWQNLMKHYDGAVDRPAQMLELSMMYMEGLSFSVLLIVLPLINLVFTGALVMFYLVVTLVLSIFAAVKERRADLLFTPIFYGFFLYLNSYLFLEQFILEVILKRRHLSWFTPERIAIK